jgi:hypothetical protein
VSVAQWFSGEQRAARAPRSCQQGGGQVAPAAAPAGCCRTTAGALPRPRPQRRRTCTPISSMPKSTKAMSAVSGTMDQPHSRHSEKGSSSSQMSRKREVWRV